MRIYDKRVCNGICKECQETPIHDFIGFEYGTLFRVADSENPMLAFIAMYVIDGENNEFLLDINEGELYSDLENYTRLEVLEAELVIIDSCGY